MPSPDVRGGDRSLSLAVGSESVVGTEIGMLVKRVACREQRKGRAGVRQKNSKLCEPQQ